MPTALGLQREVFPMRLFQAAHHKILLLLRGARGVHHVEPEGEPRSLTLLTLLTI